SEEARAAAVATEEQRRRRFRFPRPAGVLQEDVQVLVGGGGVAHVKLDGLPHANALGDRQRAGRLVEAHDVAHQEIAAAEGILVLADDAADMEAVLDQLLIAWREVLPDLL